MSKRSLWERLNSEVNIDNIKALVTGDGATGGPRSAPLDSQVDQILEFASQEARRRNKPIEDVLDELGFDLSALQGGPARRPERSDPKPTSAPKSSLSPKSSLTPIRAKTPEKEEEDVDVAGLGEEILELLDPIEPHEVELFLSKLDSEGGILDRLVCLNASNRLKVHKATALLDEDGLGKALLRAGVPPGELAAALSAEPFFPPTRGSEYFREYILENDLIRYRDVTTAARTAKKKGLPFLQVAIESGLISEEALLNAIQDFAGATAAKFPGKKIAKALLSDFPIGWVRDFQIVPLRKAKGVTAVAASYLPSVALLEALSEAVGGEVQLHMAPADKIKEAVETHLEAYEAQVGTPPPSPAANTSPLSTPPSSSIFPGIQTQTRLRIPGINTSSAVELVSGLFASAASARATDIHIEPVIDGGARVRYRIDGICHSILGLNAGLYNEVIARIKVLADMDITERRRPQDGHIQGASHDMRVATVPAKGGEKVTLRLVNSGSVTMNLDLLGLEADALVTLREVATKPFGMVLATGPVGSGKTTTLYSCLNEIDRTQRHVMSIEDPVEFNLEGANQVEVNYALGFDFVRGLRALLRQDPDTVLVGEIRDEETARIAVRASMTGLMVFSTLHANESTGAVTTLRNFHIPSFLIANSLKGVVAQRLLRRICPSCKTPHKVGAAEATAIGIKEFPKNFKAWRGTGCEQCMGSGYIGRIGVFEIFPVNETVRDMIQEESSEREIRTYALSQGMRSLQDDGLQKISEGITSLEEFHRVLRF